jgi:hypothetical protein
MSTPPQLIQMAFAAGLDESQEDEILDPAAGFLTLTNGRQDLKGGYSKRLGFTSLGAGRLDATSRTTGNALLMHGEVPCVIDGTYLDSWSAAASVNVSHGRVPEAAVTTRPTATLAADTGYATLLDCCVTGGYIVYAHSTTEAASLGTGSLVLTVEDVESGAVLRAPELIFTADPVGFGGVVCALASYSTFVFAIYLDDQSPGIYVKYLNTASPSTINTGWVTIGAPTFVVDNAIGGAGADSLSAQSLSNRVAFAYANNSAGASRVTVWTINTGGAIQSTTINTSSTTPNLVTVAGDQTDTLWVAWDETTSIKLKGLSPGTLSTVLASTATILTLSSAGPSAIGVVSSATSGKGRIISNDGGTSGRLQMRNFKTNAGAAATDGSQITVPNAFAAGRPFRVETRYYALFAPAPGNVNNTQQACVLCDFTDDQTWLRPVANLAPSLATMAPRARIESIGSSRYVTPIMVATSGAARATVLCAFDFAARSRWQSATFNGATFLSGGLLSYFDGVRVAEVGFVVRPPKPTTTNAGTGITGSFRYVLVYEEVDANGNWCVSSISDPSAVATVTNKTITVTVRPCSITARQRRTGGGEVRMALYRTHSLGEAPYYRLTTLPNDTSAATTTYADSTADVTANGQLYSPTLPGSGSAQDRRAPPFCQALAAGNGMLVVASGSDLWWAGQAVSGEGTWFNPAFAEPVEGHGDVTAIAFQDGTFYIFKRRSIYSVAGEPPSDNGAVGGLGTPRQLASDVGCIDPASVVVTSAGIFFQSERGIEILSRGGAVSWIGQPVQRTVASYPIVTGAVLDVRNSLVRFSLADSTSGGRVDGSGRDVIYDLSMGIWVSVDSKRVPVSGTPSQDAAMVLVDDVWRYGWLSAEGVIYYERLRTDSNAHLDGNTFVGRVAETSSIKPSGIQGNVALNRVLVMLRKATDHDLKVSLSYNYEQSFRAPREFTSEEIAALLDDGWPITQLKHEPHDDAECQSFRVRLEEVTPTGDSPDVGNGKGSTWLALTFDVTPKPGAFEVPEEAA